MSDKIYTNKNVSNVEFIALSREFVVGVQKMLPTRFPELSRTSGLFPGPSSPGKCQNKIPGLSRFSRTRTNPAYKCIGTKGSLYIRKGFISHRIGLRLQYCHHCIVLGRQDGCFVDIHKHSIRSFNAFFTEKYVSASSWSCSSFICRSSTALAL